MAAAQGGGERERGNSTEKKEELCSAATELWQFEVTRKEDAAVCSGWTRVVVRTVT